MHLDVEDDGGLGPRPEDGIGDFLRIADKTQKFSAKRHRVR
jgi:hypothetical protein